MLSPAAVHARLNAGIPTVQQATALVMGLVLQLQYVQALQAHLLPFVRASDPASLGLLGVQGVSLLGD